MWNLRQERKTNCVEYWALSESTWGVEWLDKLCTSCPLTASSRTDRWCGTDRYCLCYSACWVPSVFVSSTQCWHGLQELLMRLCDLLHAHIIHTGTLLYFCRVCREFWLWRNRGVGGGKAEQVMVIHPICVVTMLGHILNFGFRKQAPSLCATNCFSAMKM